MVEDNISFEDSEFDEEEDNEILEWFDGFVDYLKTLEKDDTFVMNPQVVKKMRRCYVLLRSALQTNEEDITITWGQCEHAEDTGYVEVEGLAIQFINTEAVYQAIKIASNAEIYPLLNGKVRLTIGFNRLLEPI